MLDIDGDKLISFNEFLSPILESIPPRVAIAFVSDIRFKFDVFNNIRSAFLACCQCSDVVTVDLVEGKILERQDPFAVHFVKQLRAMRF